MTLLKKALVFISMLVLILTGCSQLSANNTTENSVNFTMNIPKGFEVKNVGPSENQVFKDGNKAGGIKVISIEERDRLLKEFTENDSNTYFDEVDSLYFPTKRAIIPTSDNNAVKEIHYFLENKEHNNVQYVYFIMPYFKFDETLIHMQTFRPVEQS